MLSGASCQFPSDSECASLSSPVFLQLASLHLHLMIDLKKMCFKTKINLSSCLVTDMHYVKSLSNTKDYRKKLLVEPITLVSSKFQQNLCSFALNIFPTSQLHLHAFFCYLIHHHLIRIEI